MSLLKPKRPIRLTIEQKFFYSCGLSRALLTQVFRICEQNHPVLRLDGVGLLFERRPHSEDPLACSVLLKREKNVSVSQRCFEIPLQLISVGESDASTGKAFFPLQRQKEKFAQGGKVVKFTADKFPLIENNEAICR